MGIACCVANERDGKLDAPGSARRSRPPRCGPLSAPDMDVPGGRRLLADSKSKIWDFYEIDGNNIGRGTFGAVTRAVSKGERVVGSSFCSSGPRAVKSISKRVVMDGERLRQEIDIMKGMDHPNVVKLAEYFEDSKKVYLVMEMCSGGELFDRIAQVQHFTETQASAVMQQAVRAVNYMHEQRVVHRDLKPENFLFVEKAAIEASTLKIIDFGLSRSFAPGEVLTTFVGTPLYVSPQVLSRRYDMSCDVWSLGVITYVLLCGYPPFQAESDDETLALVSRGRFEFDTDDWVCVSEDARDLIRAMLQMNPSDRPTALQALTHDWIRKRAPRAKNVSLGPALLGNLRMFRSQHQLKKAALQVVASQLSLAKIKSLRQIFAGLDTDRDGLLSVADLRAGMENSDLWVIPPDFQKLVDDIRCNGSGVIDYAEFVAAAKDRRMNIQEDALWSAFRVFDEDGNGKISPADMRKVLCDSRVEAILDADTIYALMRSVDGTGSGDINFDEILMLMNTQ